MTMKMKELFKRGIAILTLYFVVTACLFLATDRIERLEQEGVDFRNSNTSVAVNFNK